MSEVNSFGGRVALVVGHMAGMIDQPALPVWVGTLIAGYALAPAQAGGLATLFLFGVVVSSILLSPFFHSFPGRRIPAIGFGVSAMIFAAMTQTDAFAFLTLGHFAAGFSTGLALSFTHGTMGRASNPHRIFALGGFTLGVFAIAFLGGSPGLVAKFGPATIFWLFAGTMGFACLVTAILFPSAATNDRVLVERPRFGARVWFVIFAIMAMALVQAMIFSFLERMGRDRGLSTDAIQGVFVTLGLVAVTPALLAALLQKRLGAIQVGVVGAIAQGLLAIAISFSTGFWAFAAGAVAFPFVMLFTHTFVFGHLSEIEPTGRAAAATPAMIMSGSTIAPLLGGVLVQTLGYPALGVAALTLDALAVCLYFASGSRASATMGSRVGKAAAV